MRGDDVTAAVAHAVVEVVVVDVAVVLAGELLHVVPPGVAEDADDEADEGPGKVLNFA